MHAVLLHERGRSLATLRTELRAENVHVKSIASPPAPSALPYSAFEADVALIQCRSPETALFNYLPHFRVRKYLMPLVVLDEDPQDETEKKALNLGADAYIRAPFSAREIGLLLKTLMVKKEALKESKWLRAFDLWLNLEHRCVKRKTHFIKLRNKEFSLLEFFMINRGKLLSRTDIIENVWDRNAHFSSNTVDVHINRLRRKIDDPFDHKLIHTVHCLGYIFDKKAYE